MTTQNIYFKIKNLPQAQLEQVSDYIDFLMMKNKLELNPDEKLDDQDRRILDERYEEFKANNEEGIELNDLKNDLLKKYGK